jgi:aryl-alcohol dehydrogenase-like predicted oxidoreductase
MKYNQFGTTGMRVSEIGFGGSRIGGVFASKDSSSKEALNVLSKALDAGITFYDTADMYAQGESEALMGRAFSGRRDQVILASKGGYCLPARRNLIKRIKPFVRPFVRVLGLTRARLPAGISGALSQDFSAPYLTKALEGSLKRLQTDYIDLYQLHSPSAAFMQTGAFTEALQALEKLKSQGKIRFYGVATEEPADAPYCLTAPNIASVQLGFGVLDPDALDQGTLEAAGARGLAVIARGCFAGGFLKDTLGEAELKSMTPKWPRILALRSLSSRAGRSVLENAYQFSRGTPAVTVTLLGMRVEDHLRDNLRVAQAPPLQPAEYAALRELARIPADKAGQTLQ